MLKKISNTDHDAKKTLLNIQSETVSRQRPARSCRAVLMAGFALGGTMALMHGAQAVQTQIGDWTINLQSTLSYTTGIRTAPVDNQAINPNTDDGDRNFRSGAIANRFQTLEQLGIHDGNYGFRASALAWVDTMYLQNNKNNSPSTFNTYTTGSQGFPSQTVANEGRRIEPLAAFIYGAEDFDNDSQRLTWQLGRQTITWGESLFSLDGISGLQAPVDTYQGQLLANPQAQALFLPTGAASLAYDFGNGVSADAYWQFEYEPDILQGVGSYFSASDAVGPGGERLLEEGFSIYRGPDVRPPNGIDQFGFAVHDSIQTFDLGAYFVRGVPKLPGVYVAAPIIAPGPAGLGVGTYHLFYAEPVNAFAVSASTLILGANVASELSLRTNQPLLSAVDEPTDNFSYTDPLYVKGNVLDWELSGIYLTPPLPLFSNGLTMDGELTVNDVVGYTANRQNLAAGLTREGASFEGTVTPAWFPTSGIEVDAPVGWSTTFVGDSAYDASVAGSGTIDVGLKGIYKSNLTFGINYQRYYGPTGYDAGQVTRQSYLDRDFVSLYIQRSF